MDFLMDASPVKRMQEIKKVMANLVLPVNFHSHFKGRPIGPALMTTDILLAINLGVQQKQTGMEIIFKEIGVYVMIRSNVPYLLDVVENQSVPEKGYLAMVSSYLNVQTGIFQRN